jgi:Xaa-Pro aminopeptidase
MKMEHTLEDQRERLTKCVSTPELERRWKAVRAMMKEKKIDYLVMQNSEEYMGGTIRWFTDFSARHQFPMTVIFPVDDEMTTIVCGVDPPGDNFPHAWAARGIKNRWGAVYFSTVQYTNEYEGERAVAVLKEKKKPTIGLVEKAFIPMTFYEYLAKHLTDATFVDATEWIDELRVPKSPEEIELIKGTAAMQDACAEELKNIIRPGKRDIDVYAETHCFLSKHGSERGLVQIGSGPLGTVVPFDIPHFQNRVIKDGDQVTVLIEVNGPGGYYTEILRVYVVGKQPSQALQEAYGVAIEAHEMTVKGLMPGADPKELWANYRNFVTRKGYFGPSRSFAHGQGLSLVDRPNLRPDEPWKIKAGMNIAVHPYAVNKEAFSIYGDNYITTDSGPERLHKYSREITVV